MTRFLICALALAVFLPPRPAGAGTADGPAEVSWQQAAAHAEKAHEALARCRRLVYAWYEHKGTDNFLLSRNLKSRLWNAKDSAADLWSFFVITAWLLDDPKLHAMTRQTLRDEIRLTTRLGRMTDDYDIDRNAFVSAKSNLDAVIFGAGEYAKDGLLPIIELTGQDVWLDRAVGLMEDVFAHAPVETKHGKLPADSAEVNGDLLQVLSRLYGATGDGRFKQWAERIGDAYFLDAMPKCNGLPCHVWDFAAGKPRSDLFSLSDHGNEIAFGLSELLMLEFTHDRAKFEQYLPSMRAMIDKLLEVAVNEDGLWVTSIQPSTGKILNRKAADASRNVPDTWGYALNAVWVLHRVTGEAKYRDAVVRAMRGINSRPEYAQWGRADAFADSLESGINLLNALPEPQCAEWVEKVAPVFLAKQREDGIVEGWHGDGNYARTAMMYALMKTAGTRVRPWREGLKFGAVICGDALAVRLTAAEPWKGRLCFDPPRHRLYLNLRTDYPRLNRFPEWYAVEPTRLYEVTVDGRAMAPLLGTDLADGLDLEVAAEPVQVVVRPLPGPPYGQALAVPKVVVKDGAACIEFAGEEYAGKRYQWCGREPIEFTLPAQAGKAHTLHLLWGAKKDRRSAAVTINGRTREVSRGGYDGFEWVTIEVDAAEVTGEAVTVRIAPAGDDAKPAFIAEARLTSP